MHEYMIDILVFIITVLGIIITRTVIPYIKSLIKDSEYATIYEVVETAVKAAEQSYKKIPKAGKTKKNEVVHYVTNWINNKGIRLNLTEDDLDRLIEAAVYAMNNEEL